jgi:hypothetical protein
LNEFQQRYAKLSRDQRLKVRKDMMDEVMVSFPMYIKGNHTTAQVRALARKKVDQALSLARKIA